MSVSERDAVMRERKTSVSKAGYYAMAFQILLAAVNVLLAAKAWREGRMVGVTINGIASLLIVALAVVTYRNQRKHERWMADFDKRFGKV